MNDAKSVNLSLFSIVLPIKSEYHLLEKSLISCYSINPDEVVICLDNPPHEKTLQEVNRIVDEYGYSNKTKIITVPNNPEFIEKD